MQPRKMAKNRKRSSEARVESSLGPMIFGMSDKPINSSPHPTHSNSLNSFCRALVGELIKIKRQSYEVIKPKKQSFDDFVDAYLEQNIVPFWPAGWMKKEELRSECDKR